MDIDKVRALSDLELRTELGTERRHLYDLRFQLATRQLTDHSQLTGTRRSIARLLTVMTERNLDETKLPRSAPAPTRVAPARRASRAKAATTPKAATSPKAAPTAKTAAPTAKAATTVKTAAPAKARSSKAAPAKATTTKGDEK